MQLLSLGFEFALKGIEFRLFILGIFAHESVSIVPNYELLVGLTLIQNKLLKLYLLTSLNGSVQVLVELTFKLLPPLLFAVNINYVVILSVFSPLLLFNCSLFQK